MHIEIKSCMLNTLNLYQAILHKNGSRSFVQKEKDALLCLVMAKQSLDQEAEKYLPDFSPPYQMVPGSNNSNNDNDKQGVSDIYIYIYIYIYTFL